jgi:hypothetical protein
MTPLLCQSVEGLERMHLSGHEGIGSQRRHDPPAGRAIRSIQPSSNARGGVHEDCETSHLWCNNDCVCVWRDLSHPLDGPAAPRRRLRRLSSVVDGPAQAGRSRWARGTISPAIWAEQRAQRAYVSTERVPRHTLTWLRDARERARHERMRALPRGPSQLPRQAGLRQESARKEQRMSYTSHDLLDAARRAIPEVSVEAVAARRTRGDEVVLLDVREKDEVRTGYIEGAVTIPRGLPCIWGSQKPHCTPDDRASASNGCCEERQLAPHGWFLQECYQKAAGPGTYNGSLHQEAGYRRCRAPSERLLPRTGCRWRRSKVTAYRLCPTPGIHIA